MGFGYDVSVMISWLFSCPQWLRILIVGFGYDVMFLLLFHCCLADCGFWILCFCYDFIIIQLSRTTEPKDYIYSVACEV